VGPDHSSRRVAGTHKEYFDMKKFSRKGVLLFAGVMALCAFVLPSMASAASWTPVGGADQRLDSADVGFTGTSTAFGPVTSSCTRSSFTGQVVSAQTMNITAAQFGGHCNAFFPAVAGGATCTATAVSTNTPWQATATTTTNIQIHNIRIDVTFEDTPGNPRCSGVGLAGRSVVITGTLRDGRWTGGNDRRIIYSDAEGLVSHSAATGENNNPVTVRGTFTSTGTLNVLP
jgi:hypothetical protein